MIGESFDNVDDLRNFLCGLHTKKQSKILGVERSRFLGLLLAKEPARKALLKAREVFVEVLEAKMLKQIIIAELKEEYKTILNSECIAKLDKYTLSLRG